LGFRVFGVLVAMGEAATRERVGTSSQQTKHMAQTKW
jgi:hypothetical protein